MNLRNIELTSEQHKELKEGYENGKSSAYRKRCHLVLLKQEGRSPKDIGKIVGLHQVSVNNWLNRYENQGISGLKTKSGRGRKAILDMEKDAQKIQEEVKKERQRLKKAKDVIEKDLGKPFGMMTLKRFLKSAAG